MNSIRVRADGKYIAIWCKGCRHIHGWLPLNANGRTDAWTWNPNTRTLTPSVRHFVPANDKRPEKTTCHYNITDGRITFHGDSADHGLRGEHALDDEPPANYGGAESFGFGAAGEQGTG